MSKSAAGLYIMVIIALLISISVSGPRGVQGQQGVQGPTGPMGPRGYVGSEGMRGLSGPRGLVGFLGEQGEIGPIGEVGVTIYTTVNGPNTDGFKTALVLCPEDSFMLYGASRTVVDGDMNPPWLVMDMENSGPTAWNLGFVGTWVTLPNAPDVPWSAETYAMCMHPDFVKVIE